MDKGRDEAAKKLKDGDVTDQQFRGIIMREIDDMKSKLDGLSRKDLLASIGFFREGIELLYEVFEEKRSRSEYGADTAQAACAEAVSLAEGMKHLELTESATRKLSNAKKRFERARERATDAFSNEALSPNDRIVAMQYRVMATVLEKIDHPADAVAPCKVCIEELNGLRVVQESLKVQLKIGIRTVKRFFNKEQRMKTISSVYRVNRVAYDVTQLSLQEPLPRWPMINIGEEKVDLLRDGRVAEALCKQGMENCSVFRILGLDGERECKINEPLHIATNSSRHFIVANNDLKIKVFDNRGKFVMCFRLPLIKSLVHLATDINDNIYVLGRGMPFFVDEMCERSWILKFDKTADQLHAFCVWTDVYQHMNKLSVSDSGKVALLKANWIENHHTVDVYETDSLFVCSFGGEIIKTPKNITTASDGRVMVLDNYPSECIHIFSERGDYLKKFDLQGPLHFPKVAFHRESQQIVVACEDLLTESLYIGIYTRDGDFVRSMSIDMEKFFLLNGIAVITEGCIAAIICFKYNDERKIIII